MYSFEAVTMQSLYDLNAPKKATNLSLNSDLLIKSKALKINLSATLEQALKEKLATTEAKNWVNKNKNAIKAYNEFIEENGCFGDEFRSF
jgi:antitoxin CcdA